MDKNHVLLMPVTEEWALALDEWETPLIARGLTNRTVETRIRHMRQFSREIGKAPKLVTLADIIIWGATKSWAPETRHGYYTSIRIFFRWFSATHNVVDPAKDLPMVRRPQGVPRPVPEEVFLNAVDAADPTTKLILFLAACIGLRAVEISEVHAQNIISDLHGYSLIVKGKVAQNVFYQCLSG